MLSFADSLCSGQGVNNLPTKATCAPGSSYTGTASGTGSSSGTMTMTSGPSGSSTGTASASASASSAASSSSAAAATQSGSSADKMYPVEGVGLGMAVLGFLVAL